MGHRADVDVEEEKDIRSYQESNPDSPGIQSVT
jgi:hypothetical protein